LPVADAVNLNSGEGKDRQFLCDRHQRSLQGDFARDENLGSVPGRAESKGCPEFEIEPADRERHLLRAAGG